MAGGDGADSGRERRLVVWHACAAMAVAIAVRVLFLADKPFWRDEAWVAMIARDPIQAALDGRAAPLGFLWLTGLASSLPMAPEISYRLLPEVAGIACVPLLALLARAFAAPNATAVAAMWLAAGLPPLVYFSRELKSYGFDFFFAIVVPLLAVRGFSDRGDSRAARFAFTATVAVVPWLTFSGIFAVSAFFAVGWLAWLGEVRRGRWRERPERTASWLAASVVFAASVLAVYMVALRHQASDPWMQAYWGTVLGRFDAYPLPLRWPLWTWRTLEIATTFVFDFYTPLLAALAAVGLWTWPKRARVALAGYWIVAALLCGAAAAVDRYLVVHGRLLLFLVPVPLVLAAHGLVETCRRVTRRHAAALALAVAAVLAAVPAWFAVEHRTSKFQMTPSLFFRYDLLHDVDAAIEACVHKGLAIEPILVSRRSSYAFRFYNDDRLENAWVCSYRCDDYPRVQKAFFDNLDGEGWAIVLDEDVGILSPATLARGLRILHVERFRGVQLWKIGPDPRREKWPEATRPPAAVAPPATRGPN